ncbi:MAG: hypothetical protein ACTSYA_07175 [Candidatus Kariarchaeaceae archaeon]
MSIDENTIISDAISKLDYFFQAESSKLLKGEVTNWQITNVTHTVKRGRFASIYLLKILLLTDLGEIEHSVAVKMIGEGTLPLDELANSFYLENTFRTLPEFGTPRVLYYKSSDPSYIIYEGVKGSNYDELALVKDKATHAGRLLAAIHGISQKSIDIETYEGLTRLIGQQLNDTIEERRISAAIKPFLEIMETSNGGCYPFGDFHQSNVMIESANNLVSRMYVIDSEYMMKVNFDRFDDIGSFFGRQLYMEYRSTHNFTQTATSVSDFIAGYNSFLKERNAPTLDELYPKGATLDFFLSQWLIMNLLDQKLDPTRARSPTEDVQKMNLILALLEEKPFQKLLSHQIL